MGEHTKGAGGRFAGSVNCGIDTQLATHFPTDGFGVIAPTQATQATTKAKERRIFESGGKAQMHSVSRSAILISEGIINSAVYDQQEI